MAISTFAIAEQSPGRIEFTMLSDGQKAPGNLSVTSRLHDHMSEQIAEQTVHVSDWVERLDGWVGRVAFEQDSGLSAYAFVHRDTNDKPLDTLSYITP